MFGNLVGLKMIYFFHKKTILTQLDDHTDNIFTFILLLRTVYISLVLLLTIISSKTVIMRSVIVIYRKMFYFDNSAAYVCYMTSFPVL